MADADKLLAEQYSTLVAKLNEEELEDAEEIVDALMSEVGESEELLRTRALLLIKNEDFEDAIEMIGAHPELGMGLERAYALYSLKREAEALEAIAELEQSVSAQQLEAQTLYRTGDYDGASRIYEALRRGGADGSDFSANCLAAFSVSSRKAEGLGMFRDVSADTFEGVYNGACVQINGGEYDEARNTLLAALKMGKEQLEMEGYEEDEIAADSDLLAVKVQLAYVDQVQGRAAEAMEAYADVIQQKPSDAAAVLAVARNNVVACKGERDLFDGFKHMRAATAAEGKLNRRQQKAVGANHALVLLLMGKNKECREAIDALSKKFPNDESVAVMYAALAYRQKSYKKCEDLLKKTTTPRASAASEPPDRTMQFLTLTQFYINQRRFPEAAATLASIAELRHQPAAVATLVGLHDQLNDKASAVQVLDAAVQHWKRDGSSAEKLALLLTECAAYKLRRGMSAEALASYGELIELQPDNHEAVASAIVAAAHCDPALAKKYQQMLPPLESAEGLDGEELEASIAPRISRKKKDEAAEQAAAGGKGAAAAAHAVQRKKKKKIRYPKNYDPDNPGKMPDLERWVPRHMRANAKKSRRRRNQPAAKGAQGGEAMTTKEQKIAAALDKSDKKGSSADATTGSARAGLTVEQVQERAAAKEAASPAPAAAQGGSSKKKSSSSKKKKKKR